MGFSLILRAFFSFPNERQFIECQFFWKFRIKDFQYREKRISLGVSLYVLLLCAISSSMNRSGERMYFVL